MSVMHEILSRGKRVDNGEWVYGYLFVNEIDGGTMILDCWKSPVETYVDPATVGQYTGLTDKNGVKIFEGDMLEPFDSEYDKMVVEFDQGCFMLCIYGTRGEMMPYGWDELAGGYGIIESEPLNSFCPDVEVIGNIHDNPDLLEGGGKG